MGGDSSFLAMLRIAGFLAATWGATKVSRLAGISSIVLEITTGVVLGPGIVGLIPPEYSECEHDKYVKCDETPDGYDGGNGELGQWLSPIADMDVCDKHLYESCAHHEDHETHGGISFTFSVHHLQYSMLSNETLREHLIDAVKSEIDMYLGNLTAADMVGVELHDSGDVMVKVTIQPDGHTEALADSVKEMIADPAFGEGVAEAIQEVQGIDGHVDVGDLHMSNHTSAGGHEEEDGSHHEDEHHDDGHGADASHGGGHRRLSGGSCEDLDYEDYGTCLIQECHIETQAQCQRTPDVFTLIGHTGVAMMIFESGMHFDFKMARKVGPWACVVAVIGTILPLVCGGLVAVAFGKPIMPDAVTAGTALAPTSVGISLRLLSEAGVLQLEFGQSIMTAAFVDDILSLVLFNIIFSLGDGHFGFMSTFFPSIMGILFMIFAVILAVVFWPKFLTRFVLPGVESFFQRAHSVEDEELDIQEHRVQHSSKPSRRDEALFGIMLMMLLGYATITYLCGTHLWGCFIAGMSFACLEPVGQAHHVWVKQTKRVTSWMIRIFFASTVAFAIPVEELLSVAAFWKGAIMGIGPCILTKVCCALFMGKPKFVIGWAMVGRAEFAYLIAQMGVAGNMIDQELFSIVIWALLWATIFAPIVFRLVLNKYIRENNIQVGGDKETAHLTTREAALDDAVETHEGQMSSSAIVKDSGSSGHLVKAADVKVVKDASGKDIGNAWEEDLLEGRAAEDASLAKAVPQAGGRGILCCVFFKKVTIV